MKLVVNADDYGLNENQTEAIIKSFEEGIITSATVVVTESEFRRAILRAREEKVFDKIGLHLNLTQGMPLTEPIKRCNRFCNPDGMFNKRFHNSLLGRLILTRQEHHAVSLEVEAQMRAYVDAGFPLMHFDSHHHSHTDISIAHIALPMARKMGFRSVRLSRNIPWSGLGLSKRVYKMYFNRYALRQGFVCTDYFGGVSDFDGTIENLPVDCSVELMVHPNFQRDGQFDMSGELMDWGVPMSKVKEILSRNSARCELVPYASILG